MEPTEFNLRRQCGGGEALRDSATLLEVLCSGEVIGPGKRTMQSFALINVKVPPQNPTAAVFLPSVFLSVIQKKKEKFIHQMELETTGLLLIDLIPDLSSLGLLYTPLAFVKAILSHFLYCM